jgi:GH25 family lysozyme M1 (1,4-beta-N-acetylmuramidase)
MDCTGPPKGRYFYVFWRYDMLKKLAILIFTVIVLFSGSFVTAAAPPMQPVSTASYTVADISHNNNVTDWAAIKASVSGLYIKATEGVTYTDPKYSEYTSAAKLQNIPLGFYQFFWPWAGSNGPYKARQEADSFWRKISGNSMQLIPVIDAEETNGCTAAQISQDVAAFCDELTRVDGAPGVMIYTSPSFANSYLSGLSGYPLWIANYGVSQPESASTWRSWTMWQYTNSGSLPGMSGPVDLDHATAGIFLSQEPAVSRRLPAAAVYNPADYYSISKLPYPINSRSGADFNILDSTGRIIPGHELDKGDPLIPRIYSQY